MILAMLQRLTRYGSALEINWGEDDKMWSVAWITGGVRYTANAPRLDTALSQVWVAAAVDASVRS